MITFTIDTDNNIAAHKSTDEARQSEAAGVFQFDSQAALAKVSADWPLSRFIEIWNSIPGQSPVKKFTDRKSAVARIWKAIQPLASNVERIEPTPEAEKPKTGRKQSKAAKPAKEATGAKKPPAKPKTDRNNKKAEVIAMMMRAKGATLAEIMEATQWQKHTVRGFVSILGSKGGLSIESSKNAAGERTYKVAK